MPAQIHTRETIIEAIREYARIYGSPPSAQEWNVSMAIANGRQDLADRFYADGCWPHTGTVMYWFKGWNTAVQAAGFEPRKPGQKRADRPPWEPGAALDAIWEWAQEHGRPPRTADWQTAEANHPSETQIRGLFGSWDAGIRAAGFEPRGQGFQPGNTHWRKRDIVKATP